MKLTTSNFRMIACVGLLSVAVGPVAFAQDDATRMAQLETRLAQLEARVAAVEATKNQHGAHGPSAQPQGSAPTSGPAQAGGMDDAMGSGAGGMPSGAGGMGDM